MKITKVTMTGADNSTNPADLIRISEKYPFVEWAILCSRNSQGHNRFPSVDWMNNLAALVEGKNIQLSCHLCGAYVREILVGKVAFAWEVGDLWRHFQRAQINTHGIPHAFDAKLMVRMLQFSTKEFIFQFDNANEAILNAAIAGGVNASTLFDLSHGAGVLPKEWPLPIPNIKCGYAGGLSPDNVLEQITKLDSLLGDAEIWIDMETHVRSNNDKQFDLQKVERVLEICQQSGLVSA